MIAAEHDQGVLAASRLGLRHCRLQVGRLGELPTPGLQDDVAWSEAEFGRLAVRVDSDDGQSLLASAFYIGSRSERQAEGAKRMVALACAGGLAHALVRERAELEIDRLRLAVADDAQGDSPVRRHRGN